ncbi:hypothetical protein ACFTZK_05415 [Streptomyces decoyicus]|uniref:hypothetical protein n=1 Tax=Streptomyces decoyicus TaxID=249567 RepID=UPI00363CD636
MLSARYLVKLRKQALSDHVGVCGGTEVGPPHTRRRLRVIGDRERLDITLAVDGEVDGGAGSCPAAAGASEIRAGTGTWSRPGRRPGREPDSLFTIANSDPRVRSLWGTRAGR